jgi:uncharacterized YccA/Bax inhibitor family protein
MLPASVQFGNMALRSSNPFLKQETFDRYAYLTGVESGERMTVQGTLRKTGLLFALLIATAIGAAGVCSVQKGLIFPVVLVGGIGGLILALIASFKPQTAPTTAPLYAMVEGLFIGAISLVFDSRYPGIVIQAVACTLGVAAVMLVLYSTGVIKATARFKAVVLGATLGIALVYLVSFIAGMAGARVPFLNDATPLGIGISVFTSAVAALNLIIDFDFIETNAAEGAQKSMEWYGAFGLTVTLVWLYVEMLRLLRKLR